MAPWALLAALGTTAVLVAMTVFMKVVPPTTYPPAVAIGWIQRAHIDTWLVWQFPAARHLRTIA
ncbi:MAG TPA: hypothetical protein VH877_11795 [Polyangia bacterium]|nr:hypothetical protein [Polyangia bacterium]